MYYISKKGKQGYFEWKDIDFKSTVVYPTEIYSYPIKREDWTEKGITTKSNIENKCKISNILIFIHNNYIYEPKNTFTNINSVTYHF